MQVTLSVRPMSRAPHPLHQLPPIASCLRIDGLPLPLPPLALASLPRKIGPFVYKWTQCAVEDGPAAAASASVAAAASAAAAVDCFTVMEQLLHLDVTLLSLAPTHAAALSADGQLYEPSAQTSVLPCAQKKHKCSSSV